MLVIKLLKITEKSIVANTSNYYTFVWRSCNFIWYCYNHSM